MEPVLRRVPNGFCMIGRHLNAAPVRCFEGRFYICKGVPQGMQGMLGMEGMQVMQGM